jgi:type 1 fimbria pilin
MRMLRIAIAAILLGSPIAFTVLPAAAQPKGEKVTVKGEVVDMWCYLEGGDRGAAKKQCATMCAKAGNPIAILDARGNVYVAAGLQDHQPARDLLLDKMSDEVTVTGTLVKKGGSQMLYIDSVK